MNLNPLALWRRWKHRRQVYTWTGWRDPRVWQCRPSWQIDVNVRPLDKEK